MTVGLGMPSLPAPVLAPRRKTRKIIIMLGGAFMNRVIGTVLLTALVTAHGMLAVQDGARVAADVSAGKLDNIVGESWGDKAWFLVMLIASLNFMLFVFNLIPLLPLDGGHVAGALWEGLRRQIARWRHRPDPGPVDIAKALPVAYGVASLLIGMSVLLIYADIVNPVTFG